MGWSQCAGLCRESRSGNMYLIDELGVHWAIHFGHFESICTKKHKVLLCKYGCIFAYWQDAGGGLVDVENNWVLLLEATLSKMTKSTKWALNSLVSIIIAIFSTDLDSNIPSHSVGSSYRVGDGHQALQPEEGGGEHCSCPCTLQSHTCTAVDQGTEGLVESIKEGSKFYRR